MKKLSIYEGTFIKKIKHIITSIKIVYKEYTNGKKCII